MKNAIAIAAVAGIAAAAAAQTSGSISFNAPAQVSAGQTFTVEVIASGDVAQNTIVSFNLAIFADGAADVIDPIPSSNSGPGTGNPGLFVFSVFDKTAFPAGLGDFEASGGSNVFAFQAFNSGVTLFSFQVTAGSSNIDLSAVDGTIDGGGGGTLTWGQREQFFLLPIDYDVVTFNPFTVVVPAPGAAALLGLGGLAVARRRR